MKKVYLMPIIAIFLISASCGTSAETAEPSPVPDTPVPTDTLAPTDTPTSTSTPEPLPLAEVILSGAELNELGTGQPFWVEDGVDSTDKLPAYLCETDCVAYEWLPNQNAFSTAIILLADFGPEDIEDQYLDFVDTWVGYGYQELEVNHVRLAAYDFWAGQQDATNFQLITHNDSTLISVYIESNANFSDLAGTYLGMYAIAQLEKLEMR